MLADIIPGMDALISIMLVLWQELHKIAFCLKKDGLDSLSMRVEIKIKLSEYLKAIIENSAAATTNEGKQEKNQQEKVQLIIPPHLVRFVNQQKEKWIDSAITAYFDYKPKHHYQLGQKNGKHLIVPVDFSNTGVLQEGTTWGDGLHQFLQMVHGLEVTTENITTNYISNIQFISQYGHNISGITGTIGSEDAQQLLEKIYHIDFVKIPTYRNKTQYLMPVRLADNEEEWVQAIIGSCVNEIQHGRAVLVVCETIKEAEDLYQRIRVICKENIHKYTENSAGQARFLEDTLKAGHIVVATNLAGRGTNIKLPVAVTENGGLHVCGTFLPENQRIEDQLFGRGSRKGEPGSAQLILNRAKLANFPWDSSPELKNKLVDIEVIRKIRGVIEKEQLHTIEHVEVPRMKLKDKLFARYLQLLQDLDKWEKEQDYGKKLLTWGVKGADKTLISYFREQYVKSKKLALEEDWGFWLKTQDFDESGQRPFKELSQEIEANFECFIDNASAHYETDNIISNPSHLITMGNFFMNQAVVISGDSYSKQLNAAKNGVLNRRTALYTMALQAYDKAIALAPDYSYLAYYNRAYALIKLQGENYRELAKQSLQHSQQIILDIILRQEQAAAQLFTQYQGLMTRAAADDVLTGIADQHFNELNEQLSRRSQVLHVLLESINGAFAEIDRSQRLMSLQLQKTPQQEQTYTRLDDKAAFELLKPDEKCTVSVTFHDLAKHTDITSDYQALNTIKKFNKLVVPASDINSCSTGAVIIFESERVSHQSTMASGMQDLLPINRRASVEEEKKEEKKTETQLNKSGNLSVVEAVSSVAGSVGSALSHGVGYLTSAPKSVYHAAQDWRNDLHAAQELPVCLDLRNMFLPQAIGYLDSLEPATVAKNEANSEQKQDQAPQDYHCENGIDIVLHGISGDIFEKIMEKSLSSVRVRVNKKASILDTSQNGLSTGEQNFYEEVSPPLHNHKYCECTFHAKDLSQAREYLQLINSVCNLPENPSSEDATKRSVQPVLFQVALQFIDIPQKTANCLLAKQTKGQSTLKFKDLNYDQARSVYVANEKQATKALLQFSNLNVEQARLLVKHADRKSDNFSMDTKPVDTEFLKLHTDQRWLLELKDYGYSYLFGLKEKSPLLWKSVAMLTALSIIQLTAGLVLTAGTGGFGAQVGMGLMAEGLSDLVRGVVAAYSRQFELDSYLMQKTISMALSLATAGYAAAQGGLAVGSEAAAEAGAKTANLADEAAILTLRLAKQGFRQGLITSAQKAGQMAGEKAISEAITHSCRLISEQVVSQSQKAIITYARGQVRQTFLTGHWCHTLRRAIAIDRFTASHELESNLKNAAQKHISKATMAIPGLPLCDSAGFDAFYKAFDHELKEIQPKMQQFDQLLTKHLRARNHLEVTNETIAPIYHRLKQLKIISSEGTINLGELKDYYSSSETPKQVGKNSSLSEDHEYLRYQVDNYNCEAFAQVLGLDSSDTLAKAVLSGCLEYALLLSNDYAAEREEFANHIAREFSDLFNRSVAATATVLAGVTAAGLNIAVSHGIKKAKSQEQESSKNTHGHPPSAESTNAPAQPATEQPPPAPVVVVEQSSAPPVVVVERPSAPPVVVVEQPSVPPVVVVEQSSAPPVVVVEQPSATPVVTRVERPPVYVVESNSNINQRPAVETMSQSSANGGINSLPDHVHGHARAMHPGDASNVLHQKQRLMHNVRHLHKHHSRFKVHEKADDFVPGDRNIDMEIKHTHIPTQAHAYVYSQVPVHGGHMQTHARVYAQASSHVHGHTAARIYTHGHRASLPGHRFPPARHPPIFGERHFPVPGRGPFPLPPRVEVVVPMQGGQVDVSSSGSPLPMPDNRFPPGGRLPIVDEQHFPVPGRGPFPMPPRAEVVVPVPGRGPIPFPPREGEIMVPMHGNQVGAQSSSESPFSTASDNRIFQNNHHGVFGHGPIPPIPHVVVEGREHFDQLQKITGHYSLGKDTHLVAFDKACAAQNLATANFYQAQQVSLEQKVVLASLDTLRETYIQNYHLQVEALYNQKLNQLNILDTAISSQNCEILSDLLIDARSRVVTLMGVIVVSKHMEQFKLESANNKEKEVKNGINSLAPDEVNRYVADLFNSVQDDPGHAFSVIEKELGIDFNTCPNDSMVAILKRNFEIYYDLLKWRNTMLEATKESVNKLVSNALTNPDLPKMIFQQMDAGNYTQCGRLFKDGQLGEGAFIAGSLIEGMMQQSQMASQNRMRMQCMMVQYQNKVLDYQQHIMDKVFGIVEERKKIIEIVTKGMDERLKEANGLLDKAFTQKDAADKIAAKAADNPDNNNLMELSKAQTASVNKAIDAASNAVEAAKAGAQAAAEICKSNGIDAQLVNKCIEEVTKQVSLLSETIKEIGRQDSSALSETLKVGKEMFVMFMQAKQGNAPAVGGPQETKALKGPAEEKNQANANGANNQAASAGGQISISPFVVDIAAALIKANALTNAQAPALKDKLQRLLDAHPNKGQIGALARKERQALAQSVGSELQAYADQLRTDNSCDGEFTEILTDQCAALAGGQKQGLAAS